MKSETPEILDSKKKSIPCFLWIRSIDSKFVLDLDQIFCAGIYLYCYTKTRTPSGVSCFKSSNLGRT